MIKRLLDRILGRRGEATSLSSDTRSAASSEMPQQQSSATADTEDAAPFGRWLAADDADNPFGVEGFDCRAFSQSMLSTTSDARVAESFLAQRNRLSIEDPEALPEDAHEATCGLVYAYRGEIADGALCKASVMEEKWDIYLHGDHLYFCRSWTGQLSVVAQFEQGDGTLAIHRIWTAGDAEFSRRQIDYLIRSHLLHQPAPHPLPDDLPRDPHTLAMYSFSQYGKRCGFGVYGDTTRISFRH
jgi:hypothetical protein